MEILDSNLEKLDEIEFIKYIDIWHNDVIKT